MDDIPPKPELKSALPPAVSETSPSALYVNGTRNKAPVSRPSSKG